MKKESQGKINLEVAENFKMAVSEFNGSKLVNSKRLRSCSATVHETENFYILQSYHTLIACIEKSTGIMYDALRMVYGYTATSAQHVSKFAHDYSANERLTAR